MRKTKTILFICSAIMLCFLNLSCKDEKATNYTIPLDGSEIPNNLDTVKLNYEPFLNVRYGLRYPFLKIIDNFYFFESYYLKLFRFNLIDSTWQSNFSYSTDEYLSTDKYFFAAEDSIIIASYFENNHSITVYSINKDTLALRLLKKNLLIGENFYTSLQSTVFYDNNKIIVLLHTADKILTIDLKTFALNTFQDYHLSGIRHDSSLNLSVIMGKVGRNVYLYYYSFKRLFRLNLDSFVFMEIPVPKYVSAIMNNVWDRGAVVSNFFCFWPSDSYFTLCYDVNKNVWLNGGQNPFYQKWYMPLDYASEDNFSFFQDGSVIKKISIK